MVGLVLLEKSLYLWGMKDNILLETEIGNGVTDVLDVWVHQDGSTCIAMGDNKTRRADWSWMWLDLENTASLRDFLDHLLKGTKFDPDQNIS